MSHCSESRGIGRVMSLALAHALPLSLAVIFVAAPVSGFDSPSTFGVPALQPAEVREIDLPVQSLDEGSRRRLDRLIDRFKQIPLRPVKIGTTPRTPRDPEPGIGVVVKLRF